MEIEMVGTFAHLAADSVGGRQGFLCQRRVVRQRECRRVAAIIFGHHLVGAEDHLYIEFAPGHIVLEFLLELDVVVAPYLVARSNAFDLLYGDPGTVHNIGPHPRQAVPAHKHQSVSVGEGLVGVQRNSFPYGGDGTDIFPDGLGALETVPAGALAVYVELGVAAVERGGGIGGEAALECAVRRLDVAGIALAKLVYPGAVVAGKILYIIVALEPPFDFERADAGPCQLFDPVVQTIVLGREDAPVAGDGLSVTVYHVVETAAGLDACAPVGAAPRQILRQIAIAAVAYADGPVYKELQFAVDAAADLADLVQRELALQNEPFESQIFQHARLFGGTDGALCRGVQLQRREIQAGYPQILHDEGVHPGLVHLPYHPFYLRQFVF